MSFGYLSYQKGHLKKRLNKLAQSDSAKQKEELANQLATLSEKEKNAVLKLKSYRDNNLPGIEFELVRDLIEKTDSIRNFSFPKKPKGLNLKESSELDLDIIKQNANLKQVQLQKVIPDLHLDIEEKEPDMSQENIYLEVNGADALAEASDALNQAQRMLAGLDGDNEQPNTVEVLLHRDHNEDSDDGTDDSKQDDGTPPEDQREVVTTRDNHHEYPASSGTNNVVLPPIIEERRGRNDDFEELRAQNNSLVIERAELIEEIHDLKKRVEEKDILYESVSQVIQEQAQRIAELELQVEAEKSKKGILKAHKMKDTYDVISPFDSLHKKIHDLKHDQVVQGLEASDVTPFRFQSSLRALNDTYAEVLSSTAAFDKMRASIVMKEEFIEYKMETDNAIAALRTVDKYEARIKELERKMGSLPIFKDSNIITVPQRSLEIRSSGIGKMSPCDEPVKRSVAIRNDKTQPPIDAQIVNISQAKICEVIKLIKNSSHYKVMKIDPKLFKVIMIPRLKDYDEDTIQQAFIELGI